MIEFSPVKLIGTLMLMISCARDICITSLLYVCEFPTCKFYINVKKDITYTLYFFLSFIMRDIILFMVW